MTDALELEVVPLIRVTPRGELAMKVIYECLQKLRLTYTGGCNTFADPKAWDDDFGRESHLIVIYDGGSVGRAFSLDHMDYRGASGIKGPGSLDIMADALREHGLYSQECRRWYSAIYDIE